MSWGIALFEYLLQVPANRIGYTALTLPQLKILQEVITLVVFVPFAVLYMRQPIKLDYLVGGTVHVRRGLFHVPQMTMAMPSADRDPSPRRGLPRRARPHRRRRLASRLGRDGRSAGAARLLPAAAGSGRAAPARLAAAAQAAYLADLARLGQAVFELTGALRINYAMFGNVEPALHAHVLPRYADEPAHLATANPGATTGRPHRDSTLTRDLELAERLRLELSATGG